MKPVFSIRLGLSWRVQFLAALLAIVGQGGITAASLTLARDESSAVSHTEERGVDLHHGHNEASCAACTALSFHASVNPPAPPIPTGDVSLLLLVNCLAHGLSGPELLPNSCRAPPREI
ncbi:MAG TPA: hypothetical protein VGN73_09365 [Gemmatimonadaceae bacterium]|nr:hypothetical protein [Gemmatimonadaceae bacterium]